MALYDPQGMVAPFVRRTIEQLASPGTRLVFSATHPLIPEAAAWVRKRGFLVERANEGLDLYGHRLVLDSADLSSYDEVVITNDTYALVADMATIEGRIDPGADFWGLTASNEVAKHVQSYFVCFRAPVLRNPAFAEHWRRVTALGRKDTIVNNEIGLSKRLLDAGFTMDSAYHPTASDRLVAQRRALLHGWHNPRSIVGQWNTTAILADAALDGRLPCVKLSTLRYDPFKIGARDLLGRLEERHPHAMDGIRQYLDRTAAAYGS